MIKLDEALLEDLGLKQLSVAQKNALLKTMYEEIETRVGTDLANAMTDAQLDEFEQFIDADDEVGALAWLEANFPDYRQVVAGQYEGVLTEIRLFRTEILSASIALRE